MFISTAYKEMGLRERWLTFSLIGLLIAFQITQVFHFIPHFSTVHPNYIGKYFKIKIKQFYLPFSFLLTLKSEEERRKPGICEKCTNIFFLI